MSSSDEVTKIKMIRKTIKKKKKAENVINAVSINVINKLKYGITDEKNIKKSTEQNTAPNKSIKYV
jgi:cellobiose-specific phosphotransferase system component IIB